MFTDFFIKRPVFSAVCSILIVLVGLVGYTRLPVKEFPSIDPPVVSVSTTYPGANAETVAATVDALESSAEPGSRFADCPPSLSNAKSYSKWERTFKTWVRKTETVTLYRSSKHKLTSNAGETEGEFRTRLQQLMSEKRDLAIAKIRKR